MSSAADPFTNFRLPGLTGGEIDLSAFRGKPVLIVNTASKCGFTPQYAGLEALWKEYGPQGLAVIGVPSNDFGAQEPGTAQEIAAFCDRTYGVTFPLAAKAHVRGPGAIPLFRWLRAQGGVLSAPRWNFYKYLIGRDGRLAAWFTPLTAPGSARLRRAVKRALASR